MKLRIPILLLVILVLLLAGCRGDDGDTGTPPADGGMSEGVADLYFPAAAGLAVERRSIEPVDGAEAQVRVLVEALLAGPDEDGLTRPFAEDVTLSRVLVDASGTAFVDLEAPEDGRPPSSGSMQEMQTVYSLVNTVALNVPGVRRVALLWNGAQRESFSGHLDTSMPLGPRPDMVAR